MLPRSWPVRGRRGARPGLVSVQLDACGFRTALDLFECAVHQSVDGESIAHAERRVRERTRSSSGKAAYGELDLGQQRWAHAEGVDPHAHEQQCTRRIRMSAKPSPPGRSSWRAAAIAASKASTSAATSRASRSGIDSSLVCALTRTTRPMASPLAAERPCTKGSLQRSPRSSALTASMVSASCTAFASCDPRLRKNGLALPVRPGEGGLRLFPPIEGHSSRRTGPGGTATPKESSLNPACSRQSARSTAAGPPAPRGGMRRRPGCPAAHSR